MAEQKSLANITKRLEQAAMQISPQKARQIRKILDSFKRTIQGMSTPQKHPNSNGRGGDIYTVDIPGVDHKAAFITPKNAPTPGSVIPEELVASTIDEISKQIVQNGIEAKNPSKKAKSWKMDDLDKFLTVFLSSLVATLIISLGAITEEIDFQSNYDNLREMRVEASENSNYRELGSSLEKMELNYNALLNNYAALQGSTELESINVIVKETTGHPTLISYLDFVNKELEIAKEFYDNTPDVNDQNKILFEEVTKEVKATNTTLTEIQENVMNVLAEAIKTPEMDMGMGE